MVLFNLNKKTKLLSSLIDHLLRKLKSLFKIQLPFTPLTQLIFTQKINFSLSHQAKILEYIKTHKFQ